MRRVRQANAEATVPAAWRLASALVLSLGVHAALLALPDGRSGAPVPQPLLLHATLVAIPSARPAAPHPAKVDWTPAPSVPASGRASAEAAVTGEDPITVPQAPDAVPEAGIPAVSDAVHFEAKDLDTYPRLRDPLAPAYPQEAMAQRLGGTVTLLVLIDERGRVTETSVIDAVPEGRFDEPARDALARASFTPASKDGRIVRSRILVSVAFDPDRP